MAVSKTVLFVVLTLLAFALANESLTKVEKEQNLKRLAYANNYLAVNLHQELSKDSQENVFFSPFTVSSVMSMLYLGAKGDTALELRRFLGFHNVKVNDSTLFASFRYYLTEVTGKLDSNAYAIRFASTMIVDDSYPLLPSYVTQIEDVFQACVEGENFASESKKIENKLNSWAKNVTSGLISHFVNDISPSTTLFLASAAYFKGTWKTKFNPEDTKYHPFYNGGQRYDGKDVLMMHTSSKFRYYKDENGEDNFTAIELPYEGKNMSMILILPDSDDGLHALEEAITPGMIAYIRRYMLYRKVHLTMPKFKLEFSCDLSEQMQNLGVSEIFFPGADFSGMTTGAADLMVDEVRHKAVIEVNEKGSAAAGVTSGIMTKMLQNEPTPEFKVNHPFMFVILDIRSGMILFMGRVNQLDGEIVP